MNTRSKWAKESAWLLFINPFIKIFFKSFLKTRRLASGSSQETVEEMNRKAGHNTENT